MSLKNKFLLEFYSNKSLKDLEKEYKFDQRKIRVVWRNSFSAEDIKNRGKRIKKLYIIRKRGLPANVINIMYNLLESGDSTKGVAQKLKISASVVQKYLSINKELLEQVKQRNCVLRSYCMKNLRKSEISYPTISDRHKLEVMTYFDTDLFLGEIAKMVKLSKNSIVNVFKEKAGEVRYKERVKRLRPKQQLKSMLSLMAAGKLGSKPEREFYKYLKLCIDTEIIHHDFKIMPPFEIDITLPQIKVAICWDGIGHFKPIFGEKIFKQVVYRDKQKRKYLEKIGWKCFTVQDLQSRWQKEEMIVKVYEFVKFLEKNNQGCLFYEKRLQSAR